MPWRVGDAPLWRNLPAEGLRPRGSAAVSWGRGWIGTECPDGSLSLMSSMENGALISRPFLEDMACESGRGALGPRPASVPLFILGDQETVVQYTQVGYILYANPLLDGSRLVASFNTQTVWIAIIPILQMRKPRHSEVK